VSFEILARTETVSRPTPRGKASAAQKICGRPPGGFYHRQKVGSQTGHHPSGFETKERRKQAKDVGLGGGSRREDGKQK